MRGLEVHLTAGRRAGRRGSTVKAVDGVSFDLHRGQTLGLVGESGSGKSTLARALLGLQPATAGEVRYEGISLTTLDRRRLRDLRHRVQAIFQDAGGSLNPRMTTGASLAEPLAVHGVGTRRQRRLRAADMLERVGLIAEDAGRFPHEFSGGQRQRICIARALMLEPELVICDEPVSALDVSVQAQILNLLRSLQQERRLAYLFISHDLAVVRHISHDVAVMHQGQIVEHAATIEIYTRPKHAYTRALLSARCSLPLMRAPGTQAAGT